MYNIHQYEGQWVQDLSVYKAGVLCVRATINKMSGLKGKVVIITGASSGIGAQTAVEFAKVGARVALIARRREKLEDTARKCYREGLGQEEVLLIVADLEKDDDIRRCIQATTDKYGSIDVLVNNAGGSIQANMKTSKVSDMDTMYNFYVRAVFLITKLALPYLIESKGNVVNVSSTYGIAPAPYALPSSVARAAQDQMMKAAALELAPKGVRLNSVCPGAILTEAYSANTTWADKASIQKLIDDYKAVHPAKRIGAPEEVARVILFLASDAASFVSGVALPVDSGRSVTSWMLQSKI